MSEQNTEQLQGWIRRFWWLIVLLAALLLLLCVFVGPGKALFFPGQVPTQETTPPPQDQPTQVITEQPTETQQATDQATEAPRPTETQEATETEAPTDQPTPTQEATEIIVISTQAPTEQPTETQPACKMDPTDGVCDYACGENPTNDQACGPLPNCGTDCSKNGGYCGDGSNGLFCDNGRCNGVQCTKSNHCDPNKSQKCCQKAGGSWDGACFFTTPPPAG